MESSCEGAIRIASASVSANTVLATTTIAIAWTRSQWHCKPEYSSDRLGDSWEEGMVVISPRCNRPCMLLVPDQALKSQQNKTAILTDFTTDVHGKARFPRNDESVLITRPFAPQSQPWILHLPFSYRSSGHYWNRQLTLLISYQDLKQREFSPLLLRHILLPPGVSLSPDSRAICISRAHYSITNRSEVSVAVMSRFNSKRHPDLLVRSCFSP